MDISKEIKKIMVDEDVTLSILAERLNTSQPNLSNKFKRNNFSTKEITDITNALGYEFDIIFKKKDN